MSVTYMPYNPQADPRQYFAKGFKNYLGGLNQQAESKRFGKAFTEIDPEAGMMQAIGQLLQSGVPADKALEAGGLRAREQYYKRQEPTETQKIMREGFTQSEARDILKIRYGQKPRSSARLRYEEMGDVEKLKYLTTEKIKAEGQYFGIEGGRKQAQDPQALAWANSELEKLSIYKKDGKKKAMSMPPPPDSKILEAAVGQENAQMETKAWGVIYGLWDKLSEGARNKIRQESLSAGKSFTELLNEPDIKAEVEKAVGKTQVKSPYKEYPDAFQEEGIWKVMKDGKKYRIEE